MGNNYYNFRSSWIYKKLRGNTKDTTCYSPPPRKPNLGVIPSAAAEDGDNCNPNPRKSYHFTRELTVEEKSGRYVSSCSLSSSTSTSKDTTCYSPPRRRPTIQSLDFRFDRVLTRDLVDKTTSSSSSYSYSYSSSTPASRFLSDPDVTAGSVNSLGLSPISTKKKKKKKKKVVKDADTERRHGSSKRLSLSTSAKSPGMRRIRVQSPRLLAAARRIQSRRRICGTYGKCKGFAVVKSSFDPWRDFRDSMVEMIVENGIKDSDGLEDLLVCYLSLNSEVYHDVIIAAFKQVWFDLTDIGLNENSC